MPSAVRIDFCSLVPPFLLPPRSHSPQPHLHGAVPAGGRRRASVPSPRGQARSRRRAARSRLAASSLLPLVWEVFGSSTGDSIICHSVIQAASLWFPSPAVGKVWNFQVCALEGPPAVSCHCIKMTRLVLLLAPVLMFYLFVSASALTLSMSRLRNNRISSMHIFSGLDLSCLCLSL